MNTPTTFARVSATLVFSLFSSVAFAQDCSVTGLCSSVPDRATLAGTDFIDWENTAELLPNYPYIHYTQSVPSAAGVLVTVAQQGPDPLAPNQWGVVTNDAGFRPTNFPAGDVYYSTNIPTNGLNPIDFSGFNNEGVCGFGTQFAPSTTGAFTARVEAFDDLDISMGYVEISGSSSDADATFIGISSTDAMSRVQVSIQDESSGIYAAHYAINQVDFSTCATEPPPPEVPALYCDGFASPMATHPVKVKKNRVLPLRAELFDELGFEQTDIELIAQPVVTVLFTSSIEGSEAIDVSDDTLPAGHGSDGNQFSFSDDGFWQYNLSPRNYSAIGTYLVTVDSGDDSEYVIDPTCVTSFIID